ncbi:hypothetical protein BGW39_010762 [Mortierella sp. 14UC]|nr:hypothetical protein BGW39_010762 [Mortierella sp. 14UC]
MAARFFLSIPDATIVKDPYEEVFSLFTTETTDTPWAHNRSVSQQSTRLEVELDFTPAPSPSVSQPGSRPVSRAGSSYFQPLAVVEPGTIVGTGAESALGSPLLGSREAFSSSPGPFSPAAGTGVGGDMEEGSASSSLIVAQANTNSLPKVKSPAARAIFNSSNSRKSSRAGGSSSPRPSTPQPTKKPVVIHQSLSTLSQPGQTGTVVWDSSILMSKFLLSIKGLSKRCYRTEEGRRLRQEMKENRRRLEKQRRQREQVRMLEERAERLAITENGELVEDAGDGGPVVEELEDSDGQQDQEDDDNEDDLETDEEEGDVQEEDDKPVFDPAETTILELGSGCGLLGIVMAEFCQELLLTDQKPVLPLLVKNLRKNLDKKYFDQDSLSTLDGNKTGSDASAARRKKDRSSAAATTTAGANDVRPCHIQVQELVWGQDLDQDLKRGLGVDFVVATDVVYNESIVPKLVQTLQEICEIRESVREEIRHGQGEHFDQLQEQASTRPGQRMRKLERTVVLLAQELRTDYVHLAFLEGLEQAGFRMVRIPREMMDNDYQSGYVIYAFFLQDSSQVDMQQQDPLDLPEIRASLGPFLALDSLYSCVLVNKDWRDTFTPLLWSTFYFDPEKYNNTLQPPLEANIQQYACYIQNLVVCSLTPTFQLDIFKEAPLTQLKEFRLCREIGESKIRGSLAWIFEQNPGLRLVEFDGRHNSSPDCACSDFGVLLDSPALTDLTTRVVDYQWRHLEPFRQLCMTRLRRLSFYLCDFPIDSEWLEIPMPHLQELSIKSMRPMPGLQTILKCPNLKTLRWAAPNEPSASSLRLIMDACPLLQAVEFQYTVLVDESIARLLDGLKESATEVIISGRMVPFVGGSGVGGFGFKTKAFEALSRRHFGTLTVLDIGPKSVEVTSAMVLQVLTSCSHLREITACQLMAKEIRDGPGVWACRGLEVFRIMIRGFRDPLIDRIRAAVFRRFAPLTQLRVLHMGGQDRKEPGVSLTLGSGLAQLASLTQLESVSVYPWMQSMRREDVDWIRTRWKRLRVLEGYLHPSPAVTDVIREVLTSRGKATDEGFERLAFHTAGHRY